MAYTLIFSIAFLIGFIIFTNGEHRWYEYCMVFFIGLFHAVLHENENRAVPAGLLALTANYLSVLFLWLVSRKSPYKLIGFMFFFIIIIGFNESVMIGTLALIVGIEVVLGNINFYEIFIYLPMIIWMPLMRKQLGHFFGLISRSKDTRRDYIFAILALVMIKISVLNRILYLSGISPLTDLDYMMGIIVTVIDLPFLFYIIFKYIKHKNIELTQEEQKMVVEANNHLLDDIRKSQHDYNNVLMMFQEYLNEPESEDTIYDALLTVKLYELADADISCNIDIHDEFKHKDNLSVMIVLGILIDNAKDYLKSHLKMNKHVDIAITNHNIEISNPVDSDDVIDFERVFDQGYSSKGLTRGFGLSNAVQLLQEMGASIRCKHNQDRITFYVEDL